MKADILQRQSLAFVIDGNNADLADAVFHPCGHAARISVNAIICHDQFLFQNFTKMFTKNTHGEMANRRTTDNHERLRRTRSHRSNGHLDHGRGYNRSRYPSTQLLHRISHLNEH